MNLGKAVRLRILELFRKHNITVNKPPIEKITLRGSFHKADCTRRQKS